MKDKVLNFLKKSNKDFLSGEYISKKLGVTRAAIWKYVNTLKKNGYGYVE